MTTEAMKMELFSPTAGTFGQPRERFGSDCSTVSENDILDISFAGDQTYRAYSAEYSALFRSRSMECNTLQIPQNAKDRDHFTRPHSLMRQLSMNAARGLHCVNSSSWEEADDIARKDYYSWKVLYERLLDEPGVPSISEMKFAERKYHLAGDFLNIVQVLCKESGRMTILELAHEREMDAQEEVIHSINLSGNEKPGEEGLRRQERDELINAFLRGDGTSVELYDDEIADLDERDPLWAGYYDVVTTTTPKCNIGGASMSDGLTYSGYGFVYPGLEESMLGSPTF